MEGATTSFLKCSRFFVLRNRGNGQFASQKFKVADVACGSGATFSTQSGNVGSCPDNDQTCDPLRRLQRAKTGREQMQRIAVLFDHVIGAG